VQSHRSWSAASTVVLTSIIAVLAFLMAFVSGYLFGRADPGNGPFAFLAMLEPGIVRGSDTSVLSSDEQQRFQIFWEAWQIVEREFYDKPQIDHQKLIYGAIKGMVDAVGDPYTFYQTPSQRELNDTDLRGSFDGVGIQVDMKDGKLTVVAPIESSPAEAAGLRPGDVVLEVDGKSISGKTMNDTVGLIRGPRGTQVTLTIGRPGVPDPFDVTLTRAEIKLSSVRSKMLDQQIGYVRISTFAANTGGEMTNAVNNLMAQHPRGIVLDLRNNPGGYLQSAVESGAQFMTTGSVVLLQQSGNGERKTYRTESAGTGTEVPIAVLVNKGSASASEILAGALRDNGRGILIGEKTFGKGTVQNVHQLSDQSGLRVTTAQWLTPSGQPIQGVGLLPDQVVEMPATSTVPADVTAATDPQLDAAVRYILQT
jgi:carboxyl-terminal processing protease